MLEKMLSIALLLSTVSASAQSARYFVLDNGLTVYLNEDHNEPKVFGAVVVKAGSKNDPANHTGMAHYFEHIMFKGTDKIGTVNYELEKTYLDKISELYDKLNECKSEEEHKIISKEINELSIKAADYAIPGETDKLLKMYGGTNINAYTSFDQTVFHNTFPPDRIEQWIEIYVERFRNPVFRLFQSELETVYEEQKMYADMMGSKALEDVQNAVFKKHPYRNPIIGKPNHLENPSVSRMNKFYKDYYVPNNMALIISGSFDAEKIIPIIEKEFGKLEKSNVPVFPLEQFSEDQFKGREFYSGRYVPIKAGLIAYRSVPKGHPDQEALEMCLGVLSNPSQTGLLDELRNSGKLMMAMGMPIQLKDEGLIGLAFIPKVVGSLKKSEQDVMALIEKVKKGEFSTEIIEALKMSKRKSIIASEESAEKKGHILIDLFVNDITWEDYIDGNDKIQKITKEDIVAVANKYFTNNRLVFYNKRGFSSKTRKMKKPDLAAIPSKNTNAESNFAIKLKQITAEAIKPQFIERGEDYDIIDIKNNVTLFRNNNVRNGLFSLSFKFGAGTELYPNSQLIASHFNELGTEKRTVSELRKELQKLGAEYYFNNTTNSTTLSISGFDDNIDKTLELINEILTQTKADDKQLVKLSEELKESYKIENKDQNTMESAHLSYILLGDKSIYRNRITAKEIKKLKSKDIVKAINDVRQYQTKIFYTGSLSNDLLISKLSKIEIPDNLKNESKVYNEFKSYDQDSIFLVNNRKAGQISVNFYLPSSIGGKEDRINSKFFNLYFGQGMNSVIFKEIRELRSLSYSASARFSYPEPRFGQKNGYLIGGLSTQAEKLTEALSVTKELIMDMPQDTNSIQLIKQSVRESINSTKPGFRNIPAYAEMIERNNYNGDPRKELFERSDNINFEVVNDFYKQSIVGHPIIFILTGNKSKVDSKIKYKLLTNKDIYKQ